MNEQIELMTKLAHLTLVKITVPGTMAPMVVVSIFNYIHYDKGEDSFLLPFYISYASISSGQVFFFAIIC